MEDRLYQAEFILLSLGMYHSFYKILFNYKPRGFQSNGSLYICQYHAQRMFYLRDNKMEVTQHQLRSPFLSKRFPVNTILMFSLKCEVNCCRFTWGVIPALFGDLHLSRICEFNSISRPHSENKPQLPCREALYPELEDERAINILETVTGPIHSNDHSRAP